MNKHVNFEILQDLPCQESLYVEKGKIRVGIFNENTKIKDVTLLQGDLILLNTGHDVEFLEDSRMIEFKQGPYRGKDNEKSPL